MTPVSRTKRRDYSLLGEDARRAHLDGRIGRGFGH